jgi:hypothetical protein
MVPDFLHGEPPTGACATFFKESRMKFVNAGELDRKSGCTLWRTWGTRPEPLTEVGGSNPPELADLIWTSLKFSRPRSTSSGQALRDSIRKSWFSHTLKKGAFCFTNRGQRTKCLWGSPRRVAGPI